MARRLLLIGIVLLLFSVVRHFGEVSALVVRPAYASTVFQFDFFEFVQNIFGLTEKEENNLLLPDLRISEPVELYITTDESRVLRFSTTAINDGDGPLEVLGKSDVEKEITHATQVIRQKDTNTVQQEVGTFVYHPEHEHWHIEKFTQFQLWTYKEDGSLDTKLASTDKMSFCLWDETRHNPQQKNSPSQRQYHADCDSETQGISVGWSDTYSASLVGQELDISDIPDGTYAIQAIINPDSKIKELNYDNNTSRLNIEIQDDTVRILES